MAERGEPPTTAGGSNARKTVQWTVLSEERAEALGRISSAVRSAETNGLHSVQPR